MIKQFSIKTLFKKDISTICLSIGGFYAVFGIMAIILIKMQTIMFSNFGQEPDESFMNIFIVLHKIWIVYMPLMILLGISYMAFGMLYNRIQVNKFQINLVLSILSTIWVIAYSISCIKYLDILLADMANDFEPFKYIGYVFAGIGFIVVIAVFTVPQYIIGKKIKKQEITNI